jgi:hypothetical protein
MKEKICCEYCKKVFISQYLLEKHLNRKELCLFEMLDNVKNNIKMLKITMNKYDDNSLKSKLYICAYCKITYSNKGNVKRHITNNCDERNQYIVKLKTLDKELLRIEEKIKEYNEKLDNNNKNQVDNQVTNQQEIQDLSNIQNMDKDEIIKLVYNLTKNNSNQPININITNNTNNTNNTQNNTNNTINNTQNNTLNLNNYDNPNCDFLTMEQKNKFLKDRYKGLIDFITFVYFNEKYPENHTILYTNLRSKFGHIYKNNKWFIEEIDMIADKLNDYSFDKLSGHLDEIKADEDKAEKYEKEINKGESFVEHYTSNDTTKEARTNIKKLIYNNKDLVGKTKEKVYKK